MPSKSWESGAGQAQYLLRRQNAPGRLETEEEEGWEFRRTTQLSDLKEISRFSLTSVVLLSTDTSKDLMNSHENYYFCTNSNFLVRCYSFSALPGPL